MYTKNELIQRFFALYKKYGFKSITVDDLAREMGMSKKTLYQEFENRDEIIEYVIIYFIDKLKKIIDNSCKVKGDIITKIVYLYSNLISYLTSINPVFFYSLTKYHSEYVRLFDKFKDEFYYPCVQNLFSKGIEAGVFIKDADTEYLLLAQDNLIASYLNEELANNPKRFINLILNDIRGMTTPKGYKLLNNKLYLVERILEDCSKSDV